MAALASGQWNYAVPVDDSDDYARPPRRRVNSHGKEVRSTSRQNSAWDMSPEPEANRSRGASIRSNNVTAGRKRSRNQLRDKTAGREKKEGNVDDSAWIHRDKLVAIEIKEMEAAGIPVSQSRRSMSAGPKIDRPSSRSVSRSGARRTSNHDRPNDYQYDEEYNTVSPGDEDTSRGRKRISTIAAAEEEDHEYATPGTEYRTPYEEFPSEHQLYDNYQHASRPSTSRIPVSARSPGSASNMAGRSGNSAAGYDWNGTPVANKERSYSSSSQVLADDPDTPQTTMQEFSNSENSPPKARTRGKGTPSSIKGSSGTPRPGSSHQNKNRTVSSGHRSRPSTSHNAPEGEAPWIATMYKPDPRLPPDQQILPTHMKRIMQEQWAKEGQTGTTYDRDLNLLNNVELDRPMPPMPPTDRFPPDHQEIQPASPAEEQAHYDEQPQPSYNDQPYTSYDNQAPVETTTYMHTPLSAKSDVRSDAGSIRHGANGGYKITPTIPSTPTIVRSPVPSAAFAQTPRMPDLDEKEESKQKKGCCCVMM